LNNHEQNNSLLHDAAVRLDASATAQRTPVRQAQSQVQPVAMPEHHTGDGLDFLSEDTRVEEYKKAVRHSSKVKFWKIALPVIGILVILGISGALIFNAYDTPVAGIQSISVDDGNLIMENPQLNGIDKNKRPYNLTADRAIQDVSNPTRVELEKIFAELPMDEEHSARIKAGNGVYDAELKTLVLTKKVHVETSNGLRLDLDDADIDIDKGTMKTTGPVTATSPQADISANNVAVEDNGNRVMFKGKVRMTLRPKELEKVE